MIKYTLVIFALHFFSVSFSQEEVEIIHDPRLDSLVRTQANKFNKVYRIHLTTEKSKAKINEERRRFIEAYPNIITYVVFDAPNYILKVGEFQQKAEANEFQAQLKKFPYSFIKEELVNYRSK